MMPADVVLYDNSISHVSQPEFMLAGINCACPRQKDKRRGAREREREREQVNVLMSYCYFSVSFLLNLVVEFTDPSTQ